MKKERVEKLLHQAVSPWPNANNGVPTTVPIVVDPDGSYTGRGHDPYEKPVQDADDL